MTREEAREALSVLKIFDAPWLREAIDMAIDALKADDEDEPQFYTEDDYWNGMFAESAEAYKTWTGEEMGGTSDLICRSDALEQMAQAECGLHYDDCEADNCSCSYIQRILDIPSADAGWIPCSERLPLVSGEFLVTLVDQEGTWVSTAQWNMTFGGRWQDIFPNDGYRDISNVIAWKTLPKPYKGGNTDNPNGFTADEWYHNTFKEED